MWQRGNTTNLRRTKGLSALERPISNQLWSLQPRFDSRFTVCTYLCEYRKTRGSLRRFDADRLSTDSVVQRLVLTLYSGVHVVRVPGRTYNLLKQDTSSVHNRWKTENSCCSHGMSQNLPIQHIRMTDGSASKVIATLSFNYEIFHTCCFINPTCVVTLIQLVSLIQLISL